MATPYRLVLLKEELEDIVFCHPLPASRADADVACGKIIELANAVVARFIKYYPQCAGQAKQIYREKLHFALKIAEGERVKVD